MTKRECFYGELLPTPERMKSVVTGIRCHEIPGENLTDRLGLVGVLYVFPEFKPICEDILLVITCGHYIDSIIDDGADRIMYSDGLTNKMRFMQLYGNILERYGTSLLTANLVSFMGEAVFLESYVRSSENPSVDQREYRELINAIWTKMVVTFGSDLLSTDLSPEHDDHSHDSPETGIEKLREKYAPYISGQEAKTGSDFDLRSYQLFAWTMSIQAVFDDLSHDHYANCGIPHLIGCTPTYASRAVEAGIPGPYVHLGNQLVELVLTKGQYPRRKAKNIRRKRHS